MKKKEIKKPPPIIPEEIPLRRSKRYCLTVDLGEVQSHQLDILRERMSRKGRCRVSLSEAVRSAISYTVQSWMDDLYGSPPEEEGGEK